MFTPKMTNKQILDKIKELQDASNRVMQGIEILQDMMTKCGYGREMLYDIYDDVWDMENSLHRLKFELPFHLRP